MKRIKPLIILLVLGLTIYLITACRFPQVSKSEAGKDVGDFSLQDLNGKTVKLSQYRGKVVVLNFWATWCGPCRAEIPDFIKAQKTYHDRGVEFIGISLDQNGVEEVKNFVNKMGINYAIVMGNNDVVELFGGISAIPVTIFIDRKGQIHGQTEGMIPGKLLEQVLDEMVATKS